MKYKITFLCFLLTFVCESILWVQQKIYTLADSSKAGFTFYSKNPYEIHKMSLGLRLFITESANDDYKFLNMRYYQPKLLYNNAYIIENDFYVDGYVFFNNSTANKNYFYSVITLDNPYSKNNSEVVYEIYENKYKRILYEFNIGDDKQLLKNGSKNEIVFEISRMICVSSNFKYTYNRRTKSRQAFALNKINLDGVFFSNDNKTKDINEQELLNKYI
jgi:hypothetical protein